MEFDLDLIDFTYIAGTILFVQPNRPFEPTVYPTLVKADTKTQNWMEKKKKKRPVIFWLLTKKFRSRVKDTYIEVFRV